MGCSLRKRGTKGGSKGNEKGPLPFCLEKRGLSGRGNVLLPGPRSQKSQSIQKRLQKCPAETEKKEKWRILGVLA